MNERLEQLYKGYLANSLTAEELNEFLLSLHDPANESLVSQWMDGTWYEMYNIGYVSDRTEGAGHKEHKGNTKNTTPVRKMYKWIAAASIIIIIATTAIVISNQWSRKAGGSIGEKSPSNDVAAPTNTRAVITLANGTKVYLDSVNNGTIAQENNVNIVKSENGQIVYNREDAKTQGQVTYNTLFNPRGSKVISLTLSDGTKVWLNSESSLKYPIAFNSNKREVEITGEAYFEVKHDAKQPFKVHLPNGSIVEDIGTSFNINSYSDENNIKTTLIEGSVKVVGDAALNTNNGIVLKPGQQAVLNQANPKILRIEVQTNVDIDAVMAWKNGLFHFNRADLKTVMRELARWYDLDIVYEGSIPSKEFGGEMQRDLPLSSVLRLLEKGGVHFRIEGKKLIVMQ